MPDRITKGLQPEGDEPHNSGPLCIDNSPKHKPKQKPQFKPSNPLQGGLLTFLSLHHNIATEVNYSGHAKSRLADFDLTPLLPLPKRYMLYPPLLLLPANVFSATPAWTAFYANLSSSEKHELYACIVKAFRGQGVT